MLDKPNYNNRTEKSINLREYLEEYIVGTNKDFFNIQKNADSTISNDVEISQTSFNNLFNIKKEDFLNTQTEVYDNIITYFKNVKNWPGIVYCLKNLSTTRENPEENNKYKQIVLDLREKIKKINPNSVYDFFVDYFVKQKNAYVSARDFRDKTKNYILPDEEKYDSVPGVEITRINDKGIKYKTKVTKIVLYDLTNIFGHHGTFFSGFDYKLTSYQIGKDDNNKNFDNYKNFLEKFAKMIIITKMFFDEKQKHH